MALELPLWLQNNAAYPARLDRTLLEALFAPGVLSPADLVVSQRAAGTNMSVDVAPGTVVVAGTSTDDQGVYLCRSTEVENLSVAAAPGVGSRTDLLVARVEDSTVSGVDDGWVLEVLYDTTVVPDDAIGLASITVASGIAAITNAMVTDLRVLAVPAPLANVFQNPGDMIRGTGSGTAERLPVGSTGDVLTVDGGTATWKALPPGTDDVAKRGDWMAGPLLEGTDDTLTYTTGRLTQVDYRTQAGTLRGRDTLTYNGDGTVNVVTRRLYADNGSTVLTTITETMAYSSGVLSGVDRSVT
jgi:hypothetical protein